MKTVEEGIRDVIAKKMEDGTVEKAIEEAIEKSINKSVEDLFDSYGEVGKSIKNNLKSVMVPYLEKYDYSEYIVKMDQVMVDVLKSVGKDNKKMLENFKDLMGTDDIKDVYTTTEIFEKWSTYVEHNVSTDDLEIDYDDGPSYETVEIRLEVEEGEGRDWSSFKDAQIIMECDKDKEMNFALPLSLWVNGRDGQKGEWDIRYAGYDSIASLRSLNEFEIFLMKINQNNSRIVIDEDYITDDIRPDAEPEASFS